MIQRAGSEWSYFDLFDIQPAVQIDEIQLEKDFKSMQRKLHPDLFSQHSLEEQKISAETSTLVNRAYSNLKDPLKRVKYLLVQLGIDALAETGKTISDPSLLMHVMETREEIEKCSSIEGLRNIEHDNLERLTSCFEAVDDKLRRGDHAGAGNDAVWLQYYSKIHEEISEAEERVRGISR